jgi:hypothetical protein
MSKPPAPVRIKLYGLLWVTRRSYYVLLGLGVLLLVALLMFWAGKGLAVADENSPQSTRLVVAFWNNIPWIVLGAVLLESIEVWFVLRKFSREEAAQRARQNPG